MRANSHTASNGPPTRPFRLTKRRRTRPRTRCNSVCLHHHLLDSVYANRANTSISAQSRLCRLSKGLVTHAAVDCFKAHTRLYLVMRFTQMSVSLCARTKECSVDEHLHSLAQVIRILALSWTASSSPSQVVGVRHAYDKTKMSTVTHK